MFGLSVGEVLVVACIAIVFLGPEKLPGAMANLGKMYKSLLDSLDGIRNAMFYRESDTLSNSVGAASKASEMKEKEEVAQTVGVGKQAGLNKMGSDKPVINEDGAS